jgi:hypothetical protein
VPAAGQKVRPIKVTGSVIAAVDGRSALLPEVVDQVGRFRELARFVEHGLGDLVMLDYLDRADEIGLPPAFPKPMSPAFGRIYPLVTMLNAVAVTGRTDCLGDRLDQMHRLRAPSPCVTAPGMSPMTINVNGGSTDSATTKSTAATSTIRRPARREAPG